MLIRLYTGTQRYTEYMGMFDNSMLSAVFVCRRNAVAWLESEGNCIRRFIIIKLT
jgi:hypothetical protein